MSELKSARSADEPEITVTPDGPYSVTNVREFRNWLGEGLPPKSEVTLCRCGQSSTKPYCDGSHAKVNFSGAKDPNRVLNKRDKYWGSLLQIFDNRGICADGILYSILEKNHSLLRAAEDWTRSFRRSGLAHPVPSVMALMVLKRAYRWISTDQLLLKFPKMAISDRWWRPVSGRSWKRGVSSGGLVARAFQSMSMRTLSEQTFL